MIFLPDSKTGRKPVYLNAPALDVLVNLPRQLSNPHVVCGRRDGCAYVGLRKVWRRVCRAAELSGVRLHDLRHSFASIGAAGNNSLLILGKLLGHRHAATTERYAPSPPIRCGGLRKRSANVSAPRSPARVTQATPT